MGNNSTIHSAVPVNGTLNHQPTDLKSTIVSNFNLIENSLANLDQQIESAKNTIAFKHNAIKSKLLNKFQDTEPLKDDIKRKRNDLKRAIMKAKRFSYNGNRQILLNFVSNNKKLTEIFMDDYYFIKNFSLPKKIKFLHLHEEFEELATEAVPESCYNSIILPLNREKIFYCMAIFEKKSFMKITNRVGNELHRISIDSSLYYRQFLAHDEKIIGIFDHLNNETSVVEIYNDQLRLLARRIFKAKLDLWLMNKTQLVLKSTNNHEYLFYNFQLELKFTLNLSRVIIESGYKNSVILTGFNSTEIFLYYTARKMLKKLDRKSGQALSTIELESTEVRSYSNLKTDASSNFILKIGPSPHVKYFDKDGQYLIQNNSEHLKNFNSMDITGRNDFYFCDNLNKRIFFI